jgi:exodeoxyribonuclease-3
VRIATWNVNSLGARLEKLWWWLGRARPDVLLLQETKLADADAPYDAFRERGYELAHHGEGRWNGVAIASRVGISDVQPGFGDEARLLTATCAGIRVASLYAPNGRILDSEHYHAKLAWFDRLAQWLATTDPSASLVIGGDFNVAPTDADVWDAEACHGGTHVSPAEREAFARLCRWGLIDAYRAHAPDPGRYTWWDYRAGHFHKNFGMRIDHLLVTEPVARRVRWVEIDREARKGTPTPSDHAPLVLDLDEPGLAFDAGWKAALERVKGRTRR